MRITVTIDSHLRVPEVDLPDALRRQVLGELLIQNPDRERAISELVARAQAAGAIRADIGPGDVSMLFAGVAHATAVAGELQPVLRERFIRIILDGLRAAYVRQVPVAWPPVEEGEGGRAVVLLCGWWQSVHWLCRLRTPPNSLIRSDMWLLLLSVAGCEYHWSVLALFAGRLGLDHWVLTV